MPLPAQCCTLLVPEMSDAVPGYAADDDGEQMCIHACTPTSV
jgi:hypothetical protein